MVEINDGMTTAEAILLLAEYGENVGEPERSFIEAIMEGVREEEAAEAMLIKSERNAIRELK
jgi:hypothetical protein